MADPVNSFRCYWWGMTPIEVQLSETWDTGGGTQDPDWIVDFGNGNVQKWQWLNYVNANGVHWQAKIHCEQGGGRVLLKSVEIKQENGNPHDTPGKGILILGTDNKQYTVRVRPEMFGPGGGTHYKPHFEITPGTDQGF